MSGFINDENFISNITLGLLQDIGFLVDYSSSFINNSLTFVPYESQIPLLDDLLDISGNIFITGGITLNTRVGEFYQTSDIQNWIDGIGEYTENGNAPYFDANVDLVEGETVKFITDASSITFKGQTLNLTSITAETFLEEVAPGNNRQYTLQVWFYGGSGGGTITFDLSGVPCFTETCQILTPSGYKNIKELKQGDIVLNANGKERTIEKILNKVVSVKVDHPHVIRKNQFGKNKPFCDTYLSSRHGFYENALWHHPECYGLEKEWFGKRVKYYHIKLNDYHQDKVICNGLVMDTWDGKEFGEKREYSWKCSKEKCSKFFFQN